MLIILTCVVQIRQFVISVFAVVIYMPFSSFTSILTPSTVGGVISPAKVTGKPNIC